MSDKATNEPGFEPLKSYREYPAAEMEQRAAAFHAEMDRRRTTRHFSDRAVSRTVIEKCLRTAGTAPSGAHQQPWHFVAVEDAVVKAKIRAAAEKSEREFYSTAPAEWLAALAPLGTDAVKPYLETAPWLIAVFGERYGVNPDGSRRTHYYVNESVGIATGFLLAALHNAGLVALTHTPSPMGFLREVLGRPENEKPVLLIVTGYPAADARVPRLGRKPLSEIATIL
ncbi:MAG: nitroreductase family protein [Gemmatimonadota bacterium]|nr:nitroreductase family protein [Gemmatimonadota bacterium]